ncbi:MAG: SPOR domain-containing protein [Rhodobacteraceae bacterium]|jgi:hypothetical protein|nr:SPOR domain-containing protein [Paracoccaceae bacterium]
MTQADDSDYGAYPAAHAGRGQRLVTLAGAFGSVALVAGLGWWGYDLAVRDAQGVPVIRALEGAMRVAPKDPGGEVADYQGLAVNDVAAEGTAAPPADRLVLAPPPVELSLDDGPGLEGLAPAPVVAVPGESARMDAPVDAVPVIAGGQDAAVEAALAEALGLDEAVPENVVETAALDAQGLPPPEGAITRSPRPMPRPETRPAQAAEVATTPAKPEIVDPATLPPGTRLVQFGAFDSAEEAEAQWTKLAGRFGTLMEGKKMAIEPAESGGRTFWRLRAVGFEDESDSRRFCAVLEAENTKCIPVAQR